MLPPDVSDASFTIIGNDERALPALEETLLLRRIYYPIGGKNWYPRGYPDNVIWNTRPLHI